MISKYGSVIATIAIALLLAALGYQRYAIEGLSGDLALAREKSARFETIAASNYEVLTRAQKDFNSSLSACFADYAELSARFDSYRAAIAASNKTRAPIFREKSQAAQINPPKNAQAFLAKATCEIGGSNALIDSLNALND
ncbi:MAG: hypothetical protein LBO72_08065 [Helicobacteraceae bacterium]|jgi:hypothetical protein|nr:hypothetical protein [Helicobacteraceae bacterium]